LAGGIPGILMVSTTLLPVPAIVEQYVLPVSAAMTATVTNNEVRDHLRKPVGVGLRVGALGVGSPGVLGSTTVIARDNNLVNNNFGMIVEAAFPVAGTALKGDVNLTMSGNTFSMSCQNNFLVSFSRHTTGLGLTNLPYLRNSNYTISLGGNLNWGDVWFAHPAGFGNVLTVDGVDQPNGSHTAYDANKTCPPLG
jgi:hypothetical protein